MGRQSTYTQKAADEICERLSNGEFLRQICRDDHMPGWVAVYRWINTRPEFSERVARARELGFDAIASQCLEIADTPSIGEETEVFGSEDGDPNAEKVVKIKRGDMLGHRKLQIETRLKILAKWCPKKYGDLQRIDMNANVSTQDMSEADMLAELASMGIKAAAKDNGENS